MLACKRSAADPTRFAFVQGMPPSIPQVCITRVCTNSTLVTVMIICCMLMTPVSCGSCLQVTPAASLSYNFHTCFPPTSISNPKSQQIQLKASCCLDRLVRSSRAAFQQVRCCCLRCLSGARLQPRPADVLSCSMTGMSSFGKTWDTRHLGTDRLHQALCCHQ